VIDTMLLGLSLSGFHFNALCSYTLAIGICTLWGAAALTVCSTIACEHSSVPRWHQAAIDSFRLHPMVVCTRQHTDDKISDAAAASGQQLSCLALEGSERCMRKQRPAVPLYTGNGHCSGAQQLSV